MIEEGEIITLDNQQEYAVIQKVDLDGMDGFLLMSTKKPVQIRVCTILANDEIKIMDNPKMIQEALKQLI